MRQDVAYAKLSTLTNRQALRQLQYNDQQNHAGRSWTEK